MDILLDSGSLKEIDQFAECIIGVTTNPSLLRSLEKENFLKNIAQFSLKHISLQLEEEDFFKQQKEVDYLLNLVPHATIKIPFSLNYIKILKWLTQNKQTTNVTLIFNEVQALLAESLGATYVSFFIGRLLDHKYDAFDILSQAKKTLTSTKILAASLRSLEQVQLSIHAGAEVVTCPYKVLKEIFDHHLTIQGVELFKSSSLPGKQ